MAIFLARTLLHRSDMHRLLRYFEEDPLRRRMLEKNPFPMEQATRAFFYNKSTFDERAALICAHYSFLQEKLKEEYFLSLSLADTYEIWRSQEADLDWYAVLCFEAGQRKEGLLSIEMNLGKEHLYQMMFWLAPNKAGEVSLWIGAMQGPNMEGAKGIVKEMTKRSHRYRTKNLILYMTMAVARAFGAEHIYAVSNEGYYANNHVRRNRKLKTDFGEFWEEAGGFLTEDARFYEVPLEEARKTMEEVPTRKRAVYRKRFAFQDDVDAQIAEKMGALFR